MFPRSVLDWDAVIGEKTLAHGSLDRRIVLVTGCPRSGTTVVGAQLGHANGARDLYEPMNRDSGDRCIQRYFEMPGSEAFPYETFDALVARIASLSLDLKSGVFQHETGLRRIAKRLIGGRSRQSLRRARLSRNVETVIWKDPTAAFAARAAASRFQIPVVITYRPPEAVIGSFKRLNWRFDVETMNASTDYRHFDQVDVPKRDQLSIVEGAAIAWALIYGELLETYRSFPESTILVALDDIVADPEYIFRHIFSQLSLGESANSRQAISRMLLKKAKSKGRAAEPSGHPHSQRRNLEAVNTYWKNTLTEDELEIIRHRTDHIREEFTECLRAKV